MIKSCIFGLGGTIVDKYALTTFLSLRKVFETVEIHISQNLLSKNIELSANSRIISIISEKDILDRWLEKYDNYPDEYDIRSLISLYHSIHTGYCKNLITILPETKKCIEYLREQDILIGCTTNYSRTNMNLIKQRLDNNNIIIDNYVSANINQKPYPYMIHKNMKDFMIYNPRNIIKISNSVSGIQEGNKAGCWNVGVARWSIHMNIYGISEAYSLPSQELQSNLDNSRNTLEKAGADFVINTLDELPTIIEHLNTEFRA